MVHVWNKLEIKIKVFLFSAKEKARFLYFITISYQFDRATSARYPNLTALYSIGKSVQGRDLWVIVVSASPYEHVCIFLILFWSMWTLILKSFEWIMKLMVADDWKTWCKVYRKYTWEWARGQRNALTFSPIFSKQLFYRSVHKMVTW